MEQLDLSYFCKTKGQALDFASRIATIAETIYHTNFSLERALIEQLGIQKKDRFIALLREQQINTESRNALKEFFALISDKVASLPVISLTIAFEPNEAVLQAISQWFLLNAKKQVLMDIQFDRSLIAGATLTFNGKFKDYSIRSQFQKVVTESLAPQQPSKQPEQPIHTSMEHVHLGR